MLCSPKRIPKWSTLVGAIAAIATACTSDHVVSPAVQTGDGVADLAPAMAPSVARQQAIVAQQIGAAMPVDLHHTTMAYGSTSNPQTYQFTVDPTAYATYIVGSHMVSFPAYTICDPATSGYGAGTWLNSCSKLTTAITITATTWTDANGRPQIDFANSIRFRPNWSAQLPAIYLLDASATLSVWSRVDYCVNGSCANEAATDPALVTQRDPISGYLFRLIRHFSGYNVWA